VYGEAPPDLAKVSVKAELKVPLRPEEGVVRTKAGEIWNSVCTCVAGALEESPAWLALIRQVPPVTIVTVVPETVHTEPVSEVNATVSPRSEVPVTVNVFVPPMVRLGISETVMVWVERML
jgi:hypothetical protein